jgi:hypothetical protein
VTLTEAYSSLSRGGDSRSVKQQPSV